MKKQTVLHLISAMGVSALLLFSAFSSGAPTIHNVSAAPAETEVIADKVIYVDVSLNKAFCDVEAEPRLTYVDGEESVVVNLVGGGNGVYHTAVALPAKILVNPDYSFSLFCLGEEPSTEDLTSTSVKIAGGGKLADDAYNYLALAATVEAKAATVYAYGHYGSLPKNEGATYLTQRVWLNNENEAFYEEDAWNSVPVNAISYVDESGKWHGILMDSIKNTADGATFYYADIPMDVTSFSFHRVAGGENHNYAIYATAEVAAVTYGTCYFVGTADAAAYSTVTVGSVSKADAVVLKTVLEAYLTYGENDANGAVGGTVHNLYENFFKNKSATTADLKATKLLDYKGGKRTSTGYSYEGATKSAEYSVNEKWNTLCSSAGIDPNNGSIRSVSAATGFLASLFSNQTALLAVAIGGSVVVSVLVLVLYRLLANKKPI